MIVARVTGASAPGAAEPVFDFLSQAEAAELSAYLENRDWPAGSVLFQENESVGPLGFLEQGRLVVKKKVPEFPGKYVIVAVLERGAMVGESAVADLGNHASTVVAMEDCRLLILSTEKLDLLLADNPRLGIKLLRRVVSTLTRRLRMAGERLTKLL